jgi:hypothetical protein
MFEDNTTDDLRRLLSEKNQELQQAWLFSALPVVGWSKLGEVQRLQTEIKEIEAILKAKKD